MNNADNVEKINRAEYITTTKIPKHQTITCNNHALKLHYNPKFYNYCTVCGAPLKGDNSGD